MWIDLNFQVLCFFSCAAKSKQKKLPASKSQWNHIKKNISIPMNQNINKMLAYGLQALFKYKRNGVCSTQTELRVCFVLKSNLSIANDHLHSKFPPKRSHLFYISTKWSIELNVNSARLYSILYLSDFWMFGFRILQLINWSICDRRF